MVLFCVFVFELKRRQAKENHPPGPLCWPLIGSIWVFGLKNIAHLHYTLTELANKWGPIYRLYIANTPFVVITDTELIKECFSGANPPVLLRFVTKTFFQLDKGKSLILATDRADWALMRRVFSPMVRNMPVGSTITQIILEEKVKLHNEMDGLIGKEVHLNPLFSYFTRNIFMRILQRKSWPFDDMNNKENSECINALMDGLEKCSSLLDFIPSLDFLLNPSRNKLLQRQIIIDSYIKKMLDSRRNDIAESREKARDLLDIIFLEMQNNPSISEDAIIATIKSLIVAGSATVADTLDWLVLFLCINPEVQEKCYQEIKDTLKGSDPTMEDQQKLPYLDGVIKETFRLRPAAPLGMLHVAERDFEVRGYHIAKGSVVCQNIFGIGNTERVYKNHSAFNPDRWLQNPELVSHLVPFGIGPTTCLGMPIAKQEMFLTAASLIQKYKFQLGPKSPVPDFVGEFKVVFNPKVWHTVISLR